MAAGPGARERVALSWSGGKDGALALHELRRGRAFEVVELLTTVSEGAERVTMHGVRRALLERQARALGLPLRLVPIPERASNEAYEAAMARALEGLRTADVRRVASADLFLEDVRAYRERQLARLGMEALFPVWGRGSAAFVRRVLEVGFEALVVCVDTRALDASFAGRPLDAGLLDALPPGVDPCGERGEFHTFVVNGPGFAEPVRCRPGALHRDGPFLFCDLVPG